MNTPAETADFRDFDDIDAWRTATEEAFAARQPLAHAALIEDEPTPLAFDVLICGLFFSAFLAGNAFFNWFVPACNGMEMLMISGGSLLALRLFFSHPLLALTLAFGLGDPLLDTYGHCVMGL